jgi:flagellar biosynthesis/type III secretory pathway protein FliH
MPPARKKQSVNLRAGPIRVSEGRELEWIQNMFEPLARILAQPTHLQFLQELLVYLTKASGRVPASTFRAAIAKVQDEAARAVMMTLADQLKEEGREEGREEGWQLALRQSVLRVFQKRFGLVPAEIQAQIQSLATREQLEHALDLAASVPSISAFKL